jgi:hypothetical protein
MQPGLSKVLVKQSQWEKAKVYIQSNNSTLDKACEIVTDVSVIGPEVKQISTDYSSDSDHLRWLLDTCNSSSQSSFFFLKLPKPSEYRKPRGRTPKYLSDPFTLEQIGDGEIKKYKIITKIHKTGYPYDAKNIKNLFSEDLNESKLYAIYKPSIRKVGDWTAFYTRYLRPVAGIRSIKNKDIKKTHSLVLVNCNTKQLTEAFDFKLGDDKAIQSAIEYREFIRTKWFNGWWMHDSTVTSFVMGNPSFPILWTNHRDNAQYDYICNQ